MIGNKNRNSSEQCTYQVLIYGLVTGVGFRFSAVRQAKRYPNLKGYIRNKKHNLVECIVQGPEQDVDEFVEWLKRGPPSARVEKHEVNRLHEEKKLAAFTVAT